MPIASACQYIKSLLDGLPMPGDSTPAMAAYITPPDPNEETQIPTAYVWPSEGDEDRDPNRAGSVPRNTGPGTYAGNKGIEHSIAVYLVWFAADDQPDIDNQFPGMVDAVMAVFRTSDDPAEVTDPYVPATVTTLIDVGEKMTYRIELRSLVNQAYNRYDALVELSVLEVITA
jgi:hypothetical protein